MPVRLGSEKDRFGERVILQGGYSLQHANMVMCARTARIGTPFSAFCAFWGLQQLVFPGLTLSVSVQGPL